MRDDGRLHRSVCILATIAIVLCPAGALVAGTSEAAPAAGPNAVHYVGRATGEIHIDGALDDDAWSDALSLELEYEVHPGENTEPAARTVCLITYDDRNMYFGFRAYDPDPSQIRARYSDRDNAWNDDFVGVVLDTFNDQRRAYELFSNPLGVQNDAINDDVNNFYDDSWNAIWHSAGRIGSEGYEVEMAIPFNQIRFQSANGEAQTWGLDLVRMYPRSDRHQMGLFPRNRGDNSYLGQTDKLVGMAGVSPGRNLEIIPTLTASRTDTRDDLPSGSLERGDPQSDLGLTVRWGITPNVSLNGALNPDFSQVEADALRLDINEQFALFFPEARPFFLEGADYFNTLLNLVHTRNVADPSGALKLTGKQGRHTFGVFSAQDESTNLIFPGAEGSGGGTFDMETASTVGRYKFDFGRNSTLGTTFTDRRGDGYFNTIASADTTLYFTEADRLKINLAASKTQYADEMIRSEGLRADQFRDHATIVEYLHSPRDYWIYLIHQDYGEGFRSDLGFEPQVDFRDWRAAGARVWWGEEGDFHRRLALGAAAGRRERQNDDLLREYVETWLNLNGPRQSFLGITLMGRNQGYNGVEFNNQLYLHTWFEMQAGNDLWLALHSDITDWIDYEHTRPAFMTLIEPSLRYNLGRHMLFRFFHAYRALDVEGGRLFRVHAPEIRVVHQFNNRSFLRVVLQYTDIKRNTDLYEDEVDARTKDLFTQILFSYKVNPQTAFYAGYTDGYAGTEEYGLTRAERSLFVKFSYAWVR